MFSLLQGGICPQEGQPSLFGDMRIDFKGHGVLHGPSFHFHNQSNKATDGKSSGRQEESMSTITMEFEDSIPHRFATLREYVAHRAFLVEKPMKLQAAEMDLSPSTLSRKLNPADGDTQRMNLDDLEAWLRCTGDAAAVVGYLAAKYLDTDAHRQQRLLQNAERLLSELGQVLPGLKAAQPQPSRDLSAPLRRVGA
jgi:hypothetical protein